MLELGSQDVNGALRDHSPKGAQYVGVDAVPARGVDLVIDPVAPLPFLDGTFDVVVTSSAFEHDFHFWETFLELLRVIAPGGLLYLNAPSNGGFHRYPVDCWRFYPDAGQALARWACSRGIETELIESFIGLPENDHWADFVAVFRKGGGRPLHRKGRIADRAEVINIYDPAISRDGALEALCYVIPAPPDEKLVAEMATIREERDAARVERDAVRVERDSVREERDTAAARIAGLEAALWRAEQQLIVMRNSTSWRLTSGLRRVGRMLR